MYVLIVVSFVFTGFFIAWLLNTYWKYTSGLLRRFFTDD